MNIKFSKEQISQMKIMVDNIFITDYMPFAPENFVKIYIYGLSLASYSGSENCLDLISKNLGIDLKIVMDAYRFFEGQGLVNILETNPVSIEYLSVVPASQQVRKFKKEKYKSFNDQLHAMLPGRNILPNEYNEYYNLIETMHFEIEAMLTIIAYCVRLKGEEISYQYILTVARNLAHEGCNTFDRVQERLSEFDLFDKDLVAVLRALKLKRGADYEDKRLFVKWTKTLGFKLETIIQVAKQTSKGGMSRLDALLTKYYELHLFDIKDINEYNDNRDYLYGLTKKINKIIGVYYEQLDYIIESYITKWLGFGFDGETLTTIADYCFKKNIRTIEGMNDTVGKFYKQGLLNTDSIAGFINESIMIDNEIKSYLEKAGTVRKVTSWDRDFYRTWTFSWKMPGSVIEYAASLASGKVNPFAYMNTILASWNEGGKRTLEEVKKDTPPAAKAAAKEIPSPTRNYTLEELNAMFERLNPEDM